MSATTICVLRPGAAKPVLRLDSSTVSADRKPSWIDKEEAGLPFAAQGNEMLESCCAKEQPVQRAALPPP